MDSSGPPRDPSGFASVAQPPQRAASKRAEQRLQEVIDGRKVISRIQPGAASRSRGPGRRPPARSSISESETKQEEDVGQPEPQNGRKTGRRTEAETSSAKRPRQKAVVAAATPEPVRGGSPPTTAPRKTPAGRGAGPVRPGRSGQSNVAARASSSRMPEYVKITSNLYVGISAKKRVRHEGDGDTGGTNECACTPDEPCGTYSSCINRTVFVECDPHPWEETHGVMCQNQAFTRRQYCKTTPFPTGKKGWGLKALQHIPAHTFIIEYVGEVITVEESVRRMEVEGDNRHHYFMSLSPGICIDAARKGNSSRFINHSCVPNAITQKWQVDGQPRIGIFALEDIPAGTEITFDYQFENFGVKRQECFCNQEGCRGYIGAKNPQNIDQSRFYLLSKKLAKIALTEPIVPVMPPVGEQTADFLTFLCLSPAERANFFPKTKAYLRRNLRQVAEALEKQHPLLFQLDDRKNNSRTRSKKRDIIFMFQHDTLADVQKTPVSQRQHHLDEIVARRLWQRHLPPVDLPAAASADHLTDLILRQRELDLDAATVQLPGKARTARQNGRRRKPAS